MRALAVVVLFALVSVATKHPAPTLAEQSGWKLRYSSGVTLVSPVGFTFPSPPGSMNYLTTERTTPITQAQSMTLSVEILASPGVIFNYLLEPWNTCVNEATARPYFERYFQKKYDATYAPDNYRWWSHSIAISLVPGSVMITVPLVPNQWSDAGGVFGQNDLAGFSAALASPRYVGMTFGGGCFYGHGVNVSGGSATFRLKGFLIQ